MLICGEFMIGTIKSATLVLFFWCIGLVILIQAPAAFADANPLDDANAFAEANAFADDGKKPLLVLTNFVPPYAMSNDRGRVTGMDVELVRAWLD